MRQLLSYVSFILITTVLFTSSFQQFQEKPSDRSCDQCSDHGTFPHAPDLTEIQIRYQNRKTTECHVKYRFDCSEIMSVCLADDFNDRLSRQDDDICRNLHRDTGAEHNAAQKQKCNLLPVSMKLYKLQCQKNAVNRRAENSRGRNMPESGSMRHFSRASSDGILSSNS